MGTFGLQYFIDACYNQLFVMATAGSALEQNIAHQLVFEYRKVKHAKLLVQMIAPHESTHVFRYLKVCRLKHFVCVVD